MFGGAAAILGGGAWMSGALEGGEVYPMPIAEVYEKLAGSDLPPEMVGGLADSNSSDIVVDREPGKSITWRITHKGFALSRFTATLTPAGDKATRVKVDFSIDEDGKLAELGDEVTKSRMLATIAKTSMAEQVDAVLDGRRYDTKSVGLQVAAYVATHPGETRKLLESISASMDAAAARMNTTYDSSVARSHVAEAQIDNDGSAMMSTRPMTSTRPMVDTDKYNR